MPTGGGGTDYETTVLSDDPSFLLPMDESSGSIADVVANLPGTTSGAPTYGATGAVTGHTAIDFDAETDRFTFADHANLDIGTTFTVEPWVARDDLLPGAYATAVDKGTGSYQIGIDPNGHYFLAKAGIALAGLDRQQQRARGRFVASRRVDVHARDEPNHLFVDGVDRTASLTVNINPSFVDNANGPAGRRRTGQRRCADRRQDPGRSALYKSALSLARAQAHYAARVTGGAPPTDPATLDGAILRLDPNTGAAMAGNPNLASPDANARRIIAHGYRNPFRFTFRPTTSELWVGDVGWNTWEEIDLDRESHRRHRQPRLAVLRGRRPTVVVRQPGPPHLRRALRGAGGDRDRAVLHLQPQRDASRARRVPPRTARRSPAWRSTPSGSYPTAYNGGLFFADYTRDCIWFMPAGTGGRPNAGQVTKFIEGAANPVYLTIGPGGDLFYADYDGGTIHRVTFASGNQPPNAVASATPTSGQAPLAVQFTGSGSTDPENGPLSYAWDFDGNGTDDAFTANPTFTYTSPGTFLARLRVTDNGGLSASKTVTDQREQHAARPDDPQPVVDADVGRRRHDPVLRQGRRRGGRHARPPPGCRGRSCSTTARPARTTATRTTSRRSAASPRDRSRPPITSTRAGSSSSSPRPTAAASPGRPRSASTPRPSSCRSRRRRPGSSYRWVRRHRPPPSRGR